MKLEPKGGLTMIATIIETGRDYVSIECKQKIYCKHKGDKE